MKLAERLVNNVVDVATQAGIRSFDLAWRQYSRLYRSTDAFLRGQNEVGSAPAVVSWRMGRAKLLHYRPDVSKRYRTPILCVPSLINRYYILDLMPDRSMVRYLGEQGFDLFMLDWGAPTDADRRLTLDEHICDYLGGACEHVLALTGAPQLTLMGYCMGGTMAAIYATLQPQQIANFVNLAGPIGFVDDGIFSLFTRTQWFDADELVDTYGNIPANMLLLTFQMIRPTNHLVRGLYALDRIDDPDYVRSFAAMQKWIFDQVDFPGEAFRDYIKKLYQQDLLLKDQLVVGGRSIDLSRLSMPLLNISSPQDETAPFASVTVLNEKASSSDNTLLELRGPHIGMVAGSGAPKHFWPKLADWLATRSGAPTTIDG